jgi:beta-glucuronidase
MRIDRRSLFRSSAAAAATAMMMAQARAQTALPLATPGPAPDPFLLFAPHARSPISLDGVWKMLIDPFDVAGRKPRGRRTFWLDERETPGGPLIEYEWTSSPDIGVPGDWNSQQPEYLWYDGPAYYRRLFRHSPAPGRRQFLVFSAVNYRATVWLNRSEIGSHEGGFTPFVIEVTDRLNGEDNLLVVRADSRHDAETLPSVDFDWQNYGGITRSVWLVETPAVVLRDAFVRLEGDQIVADLRVDGADGMRAPISLRIPDLGIALRGRTDETGRCRLAVAAPRRLRLWSPEAPHLYDIQFQVGEDRITDRIGFKRIVTQGREIHLNGSPLFLRGIALHEEAIGETGTRRIDEAAARALLQTAKDLGCNFVRLAHYPHTDLMSRLCDEMGLLVWAEIPVYWEDVSYGSDKTLALARAMMTELIYRDRNRVSVALWSVANETPQNDQRTHFLHTVIADIRRLDPTRLVTAALDKNVDIGGVAEGQSRIMVQDALGESLDVISMNQYEGWYGPRNPGQVFPEVTFGSAYDKPLVMSEFGADALAGHRGAREERWTEDYQAWLYEETLRCIDRDGFVGACPWILKDFRSPRRWHGRFQGMWNRKGLISETGVRKQAFDTLRAYYLSKAAGQ